MGLTSRAEVMVAVQHGTLAEFAGPEAASLTLERMIQDQYDSLEDFEIPIRLSSFSMDQQKELRNYTRQHDQADWLIVNANTYEFLRENDPADRTVALEEAEKIFDRLFPIAYPV